VSNILGINAYHGDSSAVIIRDGTLVAAVEEERFRRIKHWAGFPDLSIKYCLKEAGLNLSDIDFIAINQNSKSNLIKKVCFLIKEGFNVKLLVGRFKNRQKKSSVLNEMRRIFPDAILRANLIYVEHHEAHLASAFLSSRFEESVTVSVDGFGDFSSGAWGVGSGCDIEVYGRIYFPHSLGIFYQALTQYLGFNNYGDEYKVMGLGPYGNPVFMSQMRQIVYLKEGGGYGLNLDFFRHYRENIEHKWVNGSPTYERLYSDSLISLLGPARLKGQPLTQVHMDIAASVQAMYEEAFFHLLNSIYKKTNISRLTLAGGCAMNSVANGKIYQNTPFKHLYIQSAAGDAGGALGAALSVLGKKERKRISPMEHAYWGPQYSNEEIESTIYEAKEILQSEGCSIIKMSKFEMISFIAKVISMGGVVGWFQGRVEWGPRALGNRSILGDPRRVNMKDILNLKIKKRESFRPFAPSILADDVAEWFEQIDDVPFMMQVYPIKQEKRQLIPAVTHVDGSGRLQTVTAVNGIYYDLIKEFKNLTGIPLLLNTSFNENEPIVCNPKEALDCFLRTKMDVLVMGNWITKRQNQIDRLES
jgi:carbamoyltransferase